MTPDYRDLLRLYIGEGRTKNGKAMLSATAIAERVGVTGTTIRNYRDGKQPVDTARMVQLADAMNITNDELREYGYAEAADRREQRAEAPPPGGPLLPRLLKLRDALDGLIHDARERRL